MIKVDIKKSWFYTAGRKWGWEGVGGFDTRGVGINKDILFSAAKKDEVIWLTVDKVDYLLNPNEAIAFIKARKSFYKMPGGTMIGVISKTLCKPVKQEEPLQESKKAVEEVLQPKLI